MPGEMQLTVAPSLATTRDNDLDQMSVAPFGGIAAFKEVGSSLPVRLMIRPNFCACIVPIKAWVRLRPASKLRRMASSHSCGEPKPSTIGREPPALLIKISKRPNDSKTALLIRAAASGAVISSAKTRD